MYIYLLFSAAPTLIPTSLPSLQPATLPIAHLPQHLQTAAFQPTMMSAPLAAAAPRPAYFPQIVYWYPSPPISPQTYVTHTGPPTLVVMRGLPVNAQVQDILNFFQGFPEVCLGPLFKMKHNKKKLFQNLNTTFLETSVHNDNFIVKDCEIFFGRC